MSRHFFLTTSTAISILLSLPTASAQPVGWAGLLQRADRFNATGRVDSALVYASQALDTAETEFGVRDTNVAFILHRIGVYCVNKSPDSAEQYFRRALSIWDSLPWSNPPHL